MNVRTARSADLEAVLAIEGSYKTTPGWNRKQFQAELVNPNSLFLVAEDDYGVGGYGVAWIVPPEAQLLTIAVSPARKRRGLGKKMLQALSIMARGWGCMIMTLEVSSFNFAAQKLYEGFGFRVVGKRAKFYNDGSDALLMDLPLP